MRFSNAMKKSQFPTIDGWGLIYQKNKLSKTIWWVSAIGRLRGILLDVMTNKIIWQDHIVIKLTKL